MKFRELHIVSRLFLWLVLSVLTVAVIYPVFWMTYSAFKTNKEILTNVYSFPTRLYVENFVIVWTKGNFIQYLINSIIIAGGAVIGTLVLSSSLAYGFAYYGFRGKKILFIYVLLGLIAPIEILMIPSFVLMKVLNLVDTRISVIFSLMSFISFNVFFLTAYYQSIPYELLDAARIDGASELAAFVRIMLPQAKPALLVIGIFHALWAWNSFVFPLVYINSEHLRPITLGLMKFSDRYAQYWGQQTAALCIATWPPIIFYIIFRKHFVKAITTGALKG